jgi:hypothetical protein
MAHRDARQLQSLTAKQFTQLVHASIQQFTSLALVAAESDMCLLARKRHTHLHRMTSVFHRQFGILDILANPVRHLFRYSVFRPQRSRRVKRLTHFS